MQAMTALYPERNRWVEPFVGGAWVLDKAYASGQFNSLHAGDLMPDIIMMYRALAEGWVPPKNITAELHAELKHAEPSPLRAYVGFGSCYAGAFMTGWTGDKFNGRRTNAEQAWDNTVNHVRVYQSTDFRICDYHDWADVIGPDSVVYCDPPYANTYTFPGQNRERFDSETFWGWARETTKTGAAVFVSEYTAPDWTEVVWSRTAKQTVRPDVNKTVTEKLFLVKG